MLAVRYNNLYSILIYLRIYIYWHIGISFTVYFIIIDIIDIVIIDIDINALKRTLFKGFV